MDQDKLKLIESVYEKILMIIGENPMREGLIKTPRRVSKALDFLTSGYNQNPIEILHSALFDEAHHQMVVVKDIPFYSMCEHHILPFWGHVHIAYIPNGKVTGLSKLPRVVDVFAHRLQVQERMTQEIKDAINKALLPNGVMVVVEAQHMCMQMRGVQKLGSTTITIDYCGKFDEKEVREEFMSLLKN